MLRKHSKTFLSWTEFLLEKMFPGTGLLHMDCFFMVQRLVLSRAGWGLATPQAQVSAWGAPGSWQGCESWRDAEVTEVTWGPRISWWNGWWQNWGRAASNSSARRRWVRGKRDLDSHQTSLFQGLLKTAVIETWRWRAWSRLWMCCQPVLGWGARPAAHRGLSWSLCWQQCMKQRRKQLPAPQLYWFWSAVSGKNVGFFQ